MPSRIHDELGPVRGRQFTSLALRYAIAGLTIGSVIAVGLGIARLIGAGSIGPVWAIALLAGSPIAGVIVAAIRIVGRPSWHDAAQAVDEHYSLKDRAATSLEFIAKPIVTAMHTLQIDDAERHLDSVDPKRVVPIRIPAIAPYACGGFLLALVLLAWPPRATTADAKPAEPLPQIVAEAQKLEEDLKSLDELAQQQKDKELEKTLKELKQKVEELKQPGVDVKEALAKLSEMQASLIAQQAQYNPALVDAHLQALGEAMSASEALQEASEALQSGNHDQAAEKLEKIDPKEVDRKAAKSVKEKLKKLAKKMKDEGQGRLGEATETLGDGIEEQDANKTKSAGGKIAGICRSQSRKKAMFNALCLQCDKLSECKGNCNKNGLTKGKAPKSTTPSSTFGMGTNGDLYGEKRDLGAKRDRKDITGKMGEGPSETETTHSPEGREVASAKYKEAYQKYRKMSESVLDGEAIPLGHRQTIRRYFELIRPSNAEQDLIDSPGKDGGSK